jgi:hypothetical protein
MPSCKLAFRLNTVLEYQLRADHPEASFEYPQQHPADQDWPMASEPKRHSQRVTYPTRHRP